MPNKRKRQQKAAQPNVDQMVAAFRKMVTSGASTSASAAPRRRKKRKSRSSNSIGEQGTVTLQRRELLGTVKVASNATSATGHFDILPDSFSLLKTIAASFDRIQWKRLNVYYKPAVGSTVGGLVTVGMDWDWSTSDNVNRAKISGLTPSFTCAVWQDNESKPMVLPSQRLMSRLWYTPKIGEYVDKGPGKLHWAADIEAFKAEKVFGELWVDYSVIMQGTNPGS